MLFRSREVARLKEQLADPSLYGGGSASAKKAGELQKSLAAAERALDAAMARWAELG